MSSYAILRVAKLKQGNLAGSCAHVDRSRPTVNADPSRSELNTVIASVGPGISSLAAIQSRVDQVDRERQAIGARALRKDAVHAVEHVLTASPEYFSSLSNDQVVAWADHAVSFLQDRYGAENVVHAVLHLDESTPHIHAYHVPVTQDKQGRPALSAKSFYDGISSFSALQSDYAAHMQEHAPELKRGLKGSKARHQRVQRWYADINSTAPPQAPAVTVAEPPTMVSKQAKADWTRDSNARIKKALKRLSERYKTAIRKARRYKDLYQRERKRTQQYRELAEDPAELSSLIEETRKASREYAQGLERVQSAQSRIQEANWEKDCAVSRVKELEDQNRVLKSDLESLSSAVGISPQEVREKVPYIQKAFNRRGINLDNR